MKKISAVLFVLCGWLFAAVSVDAAVSVKKVWEPGSGFVTAGERVSFGQYQITTPDAAVSIDSVAVQGVGAAGSVFKKVIIRNGFGRVIGEAAFDAGGATVKLGKMVVLPEMYLFLTIEGEATDNLRTVPGQSEAGLIPVALHTSWGIVPLEKTNTRYAVVPGERTISNLFITSLGVPSSVAPGPMRFIGGFSASSDVGFVGADIRIELHVFGGPEADVSNIIAVALNANGDWSIVRVNRQWEYSSMLNEYALQGAVLFAPATVTLIGFFADIGPGFGQGGSVAISATPSQWGAWENNTSRRPVLSEKIIIGPLIHVVQSGGRKG